MIKSRSVLKRINLQLLITSMMATPLSVLKLTMYFLVYAFHQVTPTTLIMKRQPPLKYVREGDVNLGAILPGLGFDHAGLCGQSSFMNSSFHFSEAVIFAVDEINRNQSLLPNVQLGLVVLDDCMKESTAAIQAIRFVKTVIQDGSFLTNQDDVLESYDVAGVVGCFRSSNSMHAASILGPAEVPLVSFSSTSEALSDKEAFPYFLRVVPADNYLVEALIKLITHFEWTYISVVYVEGKFGETAFQTLRSKLMALKNVCIATSQKIYQSFDYEDYVLVMKDLLDHKNARVVIAFTDPENIVNLLKASQKQGTGGYFLWLTNDVWKMSIDSINDKDLIKSLAGSLVVSFESLVSPDYNSHVKNMTPDNNHNPWFRKFWTETFRCSLTDPNCTSNHCASDLPGWSGHTYAMYAYDAVLTYAHALDAIVKRKCPKETGRNAMKSVSFFGKTGRIEFDANGSVLAKFRVEQFAPHLNGSDLRILHVATYNARTKQLTYVSNISFEHLSREGMFLRGVPQSVCSQQCGPAEYVIHKEQVCCWDCRSCRQNEILINDRTDCLACPEFTWPDKKTNLTLCTSISPDYPDFEEPMVVLCVIVSMVGLTSAALVTTAYIKYRHARVIKATSRELSYLQLVAIFTGYMTVPVLNLKPSDILCITSFFLYCLSFTWLYAPLLVKAVRIYRIFEGGKTSTTRMKCISPKSQVIFTAILTSVQILLCLSVTLIAKPSIILTQVVKTENFVELSCDWTIPGLTSFLGYNLILVFLCSFFAFKTRKLPDNFNESRFISISVYTTLIVWLAFVPTYYTATRQYLKTLLLSLSLLVNHTVAVVFLYLPKIYAAANLTPTNSNTMNSMLVTAVTRLESGAVKGPIQPGRSNEDAVLEGEPSPAEVSTPAPTKNSSSDLSLENYDIFTVAKESRSSTL